MIKLINLNKQKTRLKGAIHVKINLLLILPFTLIFNFGETPENGRDSGQKLYNPVSKSY